MEAERLKAIFSTTINSWETFGFAMGRFLLMGIGFSVIAAFGGFVLGMGVTLPFDYGNLPGYEGSGVFGGMFGILLAGLLAIRLAVSEKQSRGHLYPIYFQFWLGMLAVQHAQAVWDIDTGPWISAILPTVATAAVAVTMKKLPEVRHKQVKLAALGFSVALFLAGVVATINYRPAWGIPTLVSSGESVNNDINIVSFESTTKRLQVIAKRGDAGVTVSIYPAGGRAGVLLRKLYLAPRYGTHMSIKNRRGWEFVTGDGDLMMDSKIPYDDMLDDISLAVGIVGMIQNNSEVNDLYLYELAQLNYHLNIAARLSGAVR